MSAKACRVCLATDVKLYSLKREPLKTAVEFILTLNGDPSSFPQFMCFLCSAIILKCLKFIEKSRLSETILYNIYEMQGEVSLSALRAVNRQSTNLESDIKIHKCPPNTYTYMQHYDVELCSSTSMQHYDIENSSSFSMEHFENVIDIQHYNVETLDDNNLILTFDDDGGGNLEDAHEVDLENEILSNAEPQESLFSFDVELKLENTKFESISLPLANNNGSSKKGNKNEKQKKPKTKRIEIKDKRPKSKEKTASDARTNVRKRRKMIKDFDQNLKRYFNIVLLTHEQQVAEIEARKLEPGFEDFPYKCDKCFKCYRKPDPYNNHMAEHHPSRGSLECAVCHKVFATHGTISRHIVCQHQRHYHCKLCPYTGKNRQALVHMKKHQGEECAGTIQCAHCNYVAKSAARLSRHSSRRHGTAPSRCACGARFATARGRRQHERTAHRTYRTENVYNCETCGLVFNKEAELNKHARDQHLYTEDNGAKCVSNYCKKCNEKFLNVQDYAEHNEAMHRNQNIYPVTCSHCSEIILDSRGYWRHIVRSHPSERKNYHSPKRTFLCDICGKGFKSVTELRVHSVRHTSRRAVPCGVCPRLFYDHYQATTHRKNVHSDQRPHKCSICDLRFKIKSNLNRHMVVHTGVRAHKCSLCDKSFTQASSRDLHVRSVHYKIRNPTRRKKQTDSTSKPLTTKTVTFIEEIRVIEQSNGDQELVNEASDVNSPGQHTNGI